MAVSCGFDLLGEGYQQLLRALQAERSRTSGLNDRLQERLSRAQQQIDSLQDAVAQRADHYQRLQSELLDKINHAANTDREVRFPLPLACQIRNVATGTAWVLLFLPPGPLFL